MSRKLLSRNVVISAAAFITMVLIFITTFDRDDTDKKPVTDVTVKTKVKTPAPAPTTAVAVAEPAQPEPAKPEPPKEVTYEEAEAAFLAKDYDAAVDLFARYTERKNENPWGFYMLGLSAWKAGAYELAEESFVRALDLDPDHVKSRVNLSRVLLETSRPAEALLRIDEVLDRDPESGVAYRLQGRAYYQLDKPEAAVDAYRRAIQIDTLDAWSMNNLALIQIEQGLFEEALLPLARALELKDDEAAFYNNLGMALENTGRFRAAEDAYARAVDIAGGYEKALDNLARIGGVLEAPGLEPVALAVLAQEFAENIKSWGVAELDSVVPDYVEPDSTAIVLGEFAPAVADADSTDADR